MSERLSCSEGRGCPVELEGPHTTKSFNYIDHFRIIAGEGFVQVGNGGDENSGFRIMFTDTSVFLLQLIVILLKPSPVSSEVRLFRDGNLVGDADLKRGYRGIGNSFVLESEGGIFRIEYEAHKPSDFIVESNRTLIH